MALLKTILSVAGSDPSGGAGIQADLKTFMIVGIYGAAVPTNLTIQNTMGVKASQPVDPELVKEQITCVLADLEVSHIKIGMIGTEAIAEAIAAAIDDYKGEVVLDPVMQASDGSDLTTTLGAVNILAKKATVLTPNFEELCCLTGNRHLTTKSALSACLEIFQNCPKLRCLVLKGGHAPGGTSSVTDYQLIRTSTGTIEKLSHTHPRIDSRNTHGTGCTFASAFAAYHQKFGDYSQAFSKSSQLVHQLLVASAPYQTGMGRGGLLHHLALRGDSGGQW